MDTRHIVLLGPSTITHSPHTCAIGGTFEFAFFHSKLVNSCGGRPKSRNSAKPSRKTRAGAENRWSATKPTKPRITGEEGREPTHGRAANNRHDAPPQARQSHKPVTPDDDKLRHGTLRGPRQSRLILVKGKIPGSPSSGGLASPEKRQLQHKRREFQRVGGLSTTFKPQTRANVISV